MPAAITVENLGKRYRVCQELRRYRTLRESLMDLANRPFRRRDGRNRDEDFWALKNVSFQVPGGAAVGIIGRNGAGKSTLLKIISRITKPTTGQVKLRGRVGSLLEVGTGFHPELTGRENVFLNGAILGMSRREIARKFDDIVQFAGVARFLDTPVKRYSSGMYVRLAFGVAAHLEPEILVVDEVLAVGDAEFQKKCLGKMHQIAGEGRTVFFVSHQMSAVQRLCEQAILLNRGQLEAYGPKDAVIAQYLSGGPQALAPEQWLDLAGASHSGGREAQFVAVRFQSPNPVTAGRPYPDGPLEVRVAIESDAERSVPSLGVLFGDRYGARLVNVDTLKRGQLLHLRKGRNELRVMIERLHLTPGSYTVSLWLAQSPHIYDWIPEAFEVEVVDTAEGLGQRPPGDGMVTCTFDVSIA